jgi:hypothetical protein
VQRALKVGALQDILPPANLRPYLIHAVERAVGREEVPKSEMREAKSEPISAAA